MTIIPLALSIFFAAAVGAMLGVLFTPSSGLAGRRALIILLCAAIFALLAAAFQILSNYSSFPPSNPIITPSIATVVSSVTPVSSNSSLTPSTSQNQSPNMDFQYGPIRTPYLITVSPATPEPTTTPPPHFSGRVAYFKSAWNHRPESGDWLLLNHWNGGSVRISLDDFGSEQRSFNASWSPNSENLTFSIGMDIYIVDAEGSPPKRIYTLRTSKVDDEDTYNTRGFIGSLAWSPDGKFIAASVVGSCSQVTSKILLIDKEGSNTQILVEKEGQISALSFSPDGSKVLHSFTSEPCSSGYPMLTAVDINNKSEQIIADYSGWRDKGLFIFHSSWSPKGDLILFDLVGGGLGGGSIYELNIADNSTKRTLFGSSPSWSPDGRFIVFEAAGSTNQCGNTPRIMIAPAIATGSYEIGCGFDPVWST